MHAIIERRQLNPGIGDRIAQILCSVHRAIADWQARGRQRRALARLDDRLLADIGVARERQFCDCVKAVLPLWL